MRLFCLFSNNFHDVTIFSGCYKSRSCSFLVLRQSKKPQKSHLLRNSKIKKMNHSSTNVFWQYQFKWSRQTNSTSNQSMVAPQEFWLLITSLLSLLFFLVVWIFVLVACKLLIKILQAQCLKITEKVSFNIAREASYVYILSGQKFIKNGPFLATF